MSGGHGATSGTRRLERPRRRPGEVLLAGLRRTGVPAPGPTPASTRGGVDRGAGGAASGGLLDVYGTTPTRWSAPSPTGPWTATALFDSPQWFRNDFRTTVL